MFVFTDKRTRFVRKSFKTFKIESNDLLGDERKIASAKNLKGMPNQFSKERISSWNVDFFYAIASSFAIKNIIKLHA